MTKKELLKLLERVEDPDAEIWIGFDGSGCNGNQVERIHTLINYFDGEILITKDFHG